VVVWTVLAGLFLMHGAAASAGGCQGSALVVAMSVAKPATIRPAELKAVLARYGALHPAHSVALPARQPDVTHRLRLTGGMMRYNWGINGTSLDMTDPGALRFLMRPGQRVRVIFDNATTMYHPMHIHGHTFAVGASGTRKDTVIVLPGRQVACDFDADSPGQWMAHCHSLYHASESGMMAVLSYRA
jgi:FtsP/CotA-like multicopper oxidase with cupredoxin domain